MPETEGEDLDNFFLYRKWLSLITGHADLTPFSYKLYIGVIYLLYVYFLVAASLTLVLVPTDKELLVKTIHVIVLLFWAAGTLTCRVVLDSSLRETTVLLRGGVFRYHGEAETEEVRAIKRAGIRSLQQRSDLMARLFLFSGFSNLVLYPLSQLATLEDGGEGPLNPYLNQPLYMPFPTRSVLGYGAGLILNLVFSVVVYGLATSMNDLYICYTGTLATQFRVLNHSLRSLGPRARQLYSRRSGQLEGPARTQDPAFQECMVHCLRSNIQHHLAILQFKKLCRLYVGSTLMILISTVAVVLATTLSLLLEKLPPNKFANYLLTGVAEVGYPFMLCYFGEDVLQESSKTFGALYDTPWMEGSRGFRQQMLVTMANVRTPMRIKTTVLDFTACLSTFGDIVSNMYKIINLIRQK